VGEFCEGFACWHGLSPRHPRMQFDETDANCGEYLVDVVERRAS
jgi:hypothetical protein